MKVPSSHLLQVVEILEPSCKVNSSIPQILLVTRTSFIPSAFSLSHFKGIVFNTITRRIAESLNCHFNTNYTRGDLTLPGQTNHKKRYRNQTIPQPQSPESTTQKVIKKIHNAKTLELQLETSLTQTRL